jgi:hypothetical protein
MTSVVSNNKLSKSKVIRSVRKYEWAIEKFSELSSSPYNVQKAVSFNVKIKSASKWKISLFRSFVNVEIEMRKGKDG